MNSFRQTKYQKKNIQKISPLYKYWESAQTDLDEEQRLALANNENPAAALFKKEPYKWEILFQSVTKEIIKGDQSSIKAFMVLILMLNKEQQNTLIQKFKDQRIFSEDAMQKLTSKEAMNLPTTKNQKRFLRILISIFTNPYNIKIKREKAHIYEYTGAIFCAVSNLFK